MYMCTLAWADIFVIVNVSVSYFIAACTDTHIHMLLLTKNVHKPHIQMLEE
jgi:hypothetical protein